MRTPSRRSGFDRMWFRPPASRRDTEATVTTEASGHVQHYRGLFFALAAFAQAWPQSTNVPAPCLVAGSGDVGRGSGVVLVAVVRRPVRLTDPTDVAPVGRPNAVDNRGRLAYVVTLRPLRPLAPSR
ncbi:hypothetical protein TNCT6_70290 [Streptomyces sp. 6-11-2]|nr:hypothetical protein TNCT6_70290 [Streptomyces sp. 6-11-2]